ncbi:MAG: hypothetical protein QOI08_3990 [Actinomycetota bacterium]|nr:hypothetical protein [Actinomycetota bacterium]
MRRIMTWTAIVVPAAAAFFALLVYAQIGFSDSQVVVPRSIPLALAGIPERHFGDSRPNGIISAYPASS